MVDTDERRRTTNDGRWTTPRVWHKLPTGELKIDTMFVDISGRCIRVTFLQVQNTPVQLYDKPRGPKNDFNCTLVTRK